MLSLSMNPVAKLSYDTFRLGYEAHSLIGLRLFAMATGGVPALSEALRMVPEKLVALADAQMGFPLWRGGFCKEPEPPRRMV